MLYTYYNCCFNCCNQSKKFFILDCLKKILSLKARSEFFRRSAFYSIYFLLSQHIKYKSLFCSFYHQAGTKSLFARHHGRKTTRLIFPASPPHKEDFVSHSLSLSRGKILQINTARRSDVGACWHLTSFISLARDNTLLLFNFRTSI